MTEQRHAFPLPVPLRSELPDAPARIAALPVHRGYPVPWFVGWLDDRGESCPVGTGTPDFRVIRPGGVADALLRECCWICGGGLGSTVAFVIGPMCAVNRVSAEPPSHVECAEWSVRACPFLTRPHMERREAGLPDADEPAGIMVRRNPGLGLVWVTKRTAYRGFPAPGGVLFNVGDPLRVDWVREGRAATRAEVLDSIESGLPLLRAEADKQGRRAHEQLDRMVVRAETLYPAE